MDTRLSPLLGGNTLLSYLHIGNKKKKNNKIIAINYVLHAAYIHVCCILITMKSCALNLKYYTFCLPTFPRELQEPSYIHFNTHKMKLNTIINQSGVLCNKFPRVSHGLPTNVGVDLN